MRRRRLESALRARFFLVLTCTAPASPPVSSDSTTSSGGYGVFASKSASPAGGNGMPMRDFRALSVAEVPRGDTIQVVLEFDGDDMPRDVARTVTPRRG